MKKFLSLVLALVMTMSLVTVSAGAKDFTDSTKIQYNEAVDCCFIVPTQFLYLLSIKIDRKSEFNVLQETAIRLLLLVNIYSFNGVAIHTAVYVFPLKVSMNFSIP